MSIFTKFLRLLNVSVAVVIGNRLGLVLSRVFCPIDAVVDGVGGVWPPLPMTLPLLLVTPKTAPPPPPPPPRLVN